MTDGVGVGTLQRSPSGFLGLTKDRAVSINELGFLFIRIWDSREGTLWIRKRQQPFRLSKGGLKTWA